MSFQKALMGKTKSQGGMNLPELKIYLMGMYPSHAPRMKNLDRGGIIRYYRRNIEEKSRHSQNSSYFLKDAKISESQRKYCRCVAHISAKNDEWCYTHGMWKRGRSSGRSLSKRKCYNPYAVCTKATHRRGPGSRECLKYMDLDNMPLSEVKALANLKGVSVNELKRKVQREQ